MTGTPVLSAHNPASAAVLSRALPHTVVPRTVVAALSLFFLHRDLAAGDSCAECPAPQPPDDKGLWHPTVAQSEAPRRRGSVLHHRTRAPPPLSADRIVVTIDAAAMLPPLLEAKAEMSAAVLQRLSDLRAEIGPFLRLPVLDEATLPAPMLGYRSEPTRRAIWCQWWTVADEAASSLRFFCPDTHIGAHESPYDITFANCDTELRCFVALVTAVKLRCRVVRLQGAADDASIVNAIEATREFPVRFGLRPPSADFAAMAAFADV